MTFKIIRNPIFHIVFFGMLLAVVLLIVKGPPTSSEETQRVVITDSDIEQLRATWMRQWQREPTPQELRGQVQSFIREEVMYREALARGFDQDDMIVRRAMQRKMEFLGETQILREEPSDEEVQAYFSLRQERYRVPAVMSFAHIYFNFDKRGADAESDARQTLADIQSMPPNDDILGRFGDPILLQNQYVEQTEQDVRSVFGADFLEAILQLEPGRWEGPVQSGYGLHLVYVYARQDSYIPEWQAVKFHIRDDMAREAKKAAKELFYTEILRNYQIVYRGETLDILGENDQ